MTTKQELKKIQNAILQYAFKAKWIVKDRLMPHIRNRVKGVAVSDKDIQDALDLLIKRGDVVIQPGNTYGHTVWILSKDARKEIDATREEARKAEAEEEERKAHALQEIEDQQRELAEQQEDLERAKAEI